MKLIDINLTVKGPQGCGKTTFIEKILPRIAEEAEAHFDGHSTDLMVTATEEQTPLVPVNLVDSLDALRFSIDTQQTSQKRMNELLKELGCDEATLTSLNDMNDALSRASLKLFAMTETLLKEQENNDEEKNDAR